MVRWVGWVGWCSVGCGGMESKNDLCLVKKWVCVC